jgi:hypothetical protein
LAHSDNRSVAQTKNADHPLAFVDHRQSADLQLLHVPHCLGEVIVIPAAMDRIPINTLALAARLPTSHANREAVEAGGLMSYGPNFPSLFRRAADYVDKVLRGTKPGDIPIEQPTKFDLIINLTTAKALGLTIPESFLLRADEVIE